MSWKLWGNHCGQRGENVIIFLLMSPGRACGPAGRPRKKGRIQRERFLEYQKGDFPGHERIEAV